MNSLTDLRTTLDRHAGSVTDEDAVIRTTAVRHRVAAVRRRRRAVGGGALALVVAAVAATGLRMDDRRHPAPTAPLVLGQRAPQTMTSLGYTYAATGATHVVDGRGTVPITASSHPRLVSWTTDHPTAVRFVLPDGEVLRTRTSHFHDFLYLPSGATGTLRVSAAGGRVGLATYDLTGRAPAGYTRAGLTYRSTVAGAPLMAAGIGALGRAELRTSYVAPHGWVGIHVMCSGLPKGDVLNVSLNGDGRVTGDSCDSDGTFDPGAGGGVAFPPTHPGQTVHVRAWISTTHHHAVAVPAASVPDLRLGVGVYGPLPQLRVGGTQVPTVVEHTGHTWRLESSTDSTGAPLMLRATSYDRIAMMAWHTHGWTEVTFGAGRAVAPEGGSFTGGQAAIPDLWVPAGARVHASLDRGTGTFGVALYRRVD